MAFMYWLLECVDRFIRRYLVDDGYDWVLVAIVAAVIAVLMSFVGP